MLGTLVDGSAASSAARCHIADICIGPCAQLEEFRRKKLERVAGRSAAGSAPSTPASVLKKPVEGAGQTTVSPKNPLGDRNASPVMQEPLQPPTPRGDHAAAAAAAHAASPAAASARDAGAAAPLPSPRYSPRDHPGSVVRLPCSPLGLFMWCACTDRFELFAVWAASVESVARRSLADALLPSDANDALCRVSPRLGPQTPPPRASLSCSRRMSTGGPREVSRAAPAARVRLADRCVSRSSIGF